jgi:hypothetical protein
MLDNDHDYDNDNELPRDFCTAPLEIQLNAPLDTITACKRGHRWRGGARRTGA